MSASRQISSLLIQEFPSGRSCANLGVPEPHSLREWMDMPLGANMLPWLKGKELARLQRMLEYFLLNSQICRQTENHSQLRRAVQFIIQIADPLAAAFESILFSLGALACSSL